MKTIVCTDIKVYKVENDENDSSTQRPKERQTLKVHLIRANRTNETITSFFQGPSNVCHVDNGSRQKVLGPKKTLRPFYKCEI